VLLELKARLTAYAREEEARRELAAEQARIAAEAAEAAAREAERIEQQTKADASTGVLDANVVRPSRTPIRSSPSLNRPAALPHAPKRKRHSASAMGATKH
jgi:hypothetical protein